MKRFKIGDRVQDSGFLGEGEVTEIVKSDLDSSNIVGYMVMFDKTPDFRYNMGENPTFMLNGEITTEIKDKNMESLTVDEAIKQGYTHCMDTHSGWEAATPINDLMEKDFKEKEWLLVEKKPRVPSIKLEVLKEWIVEAVTQDDYNKTERDNDDIWNEVMKLDFSDTAKQINDAIAKHKYFTTTKIRVVE